MSKRLVLTKEIESVFNDADNSSAGFAARLLAAGIGDRESARPYAELWAIKKHGNIKHNSAGEQAMYRVLRRCFPKDELPSKKPKGNNKTKRAAIPRVMRHAANEFLAEFEGETKAEQIKQAIALLRALQQ